MSERTQGPAVRDPDKPLSWFRFESDFTTNPTVGMLPDFAKLVLVHAMCATARRIAPCNDERFAWWARLDRTRLTEAKAQLLEAGLISEDWEPTDWERHQPPIDRTNAERQRRLQQRRRDHRQASSGDNGVSNDDVTLTQDRTGEDRTGHDTTGQDRTGEDIDTEVAAEPPARTRGGSASEKPEGCTREGKPSPDPLLGMPRARGKLRSGDFEDVNERVAKVLGTGAVRPDDLEGLAKATSLSPKQVAASLRQLRDRGLM